MKEYDFKGKKGVDDLLNTSPYYGEWNDKTFKDVDYSDNNAVSREIVRREEHNLRYIEQLKKDGKYLEEYTISVSVTPDPKFDNNYPEPQQMDSYKYEIIDLSKYNDK